MSGGYHVIQLRGRPAIALPVGPKRVRVAGLMRLQPNTLRRTLFRWGLRLAVESGLDVLLGSVPSPLDARLEYNFAAWLEAVRSSLGERDAKAVVVWPPEPHRGRVYVHLLRPDTTPLAFAKLAFDADGDGCLAAEARALEALGTAGLKECRVPRVLDTGRFPVHRYLLLEPTPANARPVKPAHDAFPSACVQEYAGSPRVIQGNDLRQLPWWRKFRRRAGECPRFAEEVDRLRGSPVRVCRVHGDLGPGNMVRSGPELWLLDWEQSCPQAPESTDTISYYLGLRVRQVYRRPQQALQAFAARYLSSESSFTRRNVLMGLAFLHGAGFAVATQLTNVWNNDLVNTNGR
jgi:hypothetical protein